MIRVEVWSAGERFVTYEDVVRAFSWCRKNLGEPGERWAYGKINPDFTGRVFVSSPEEIEYFEFDNNEDLLAFRLVF